MKWSKKRVVGLVAMVLVAAVAIGGIALWVHENKLEQLQNEALEELQRNIGQYDEQSIVLYDTSKANAEELAKLYGAQLRISANGRFATLTLPEGTTIRDVYAMKESRKHIDEMAADYHVQTSDLVQEAENGERLPDRPQYTVADGDYELQTYLDYLNMGRVWNSYSGSGVTVAIIDTGIDTDHPEFAGRISEYSYNATEDKIVKDYVASDGGYDWSLIEDENGHGTAVAGVIAAGMDGSGTVGIAPKVKILVIKAESDASGSFSRTSDLVFGLYYAIEQDVQIVNMSFGSNTQENPFAAATRLAYDSDIICVAAAGNCSTSGMNWPASDPYVIGVGALDGWELAYYSNYGENVDVCAPGTTYTTLKDGKYGAMHGTSLAAPIVAGAVALYMQTDKYATFDEVTQILYASSYDLGTPGHDWEYGFGALDISAFILENRGTVTYDMLTDELEDLRSLFVTGHPLQQLPEPERLYYVFDGWYYDDTFTQEVDYYTDAFYGDITLYAKWVNEDEGLPYTYILLDDGTVEITGYTGNRKYITVPEKIEGRIVSSIGQSAFAGQNKLREVTLPVGLTHIGTSAFEDCANLLYIEIPAGVRKIGMCAFADCVRLSGVAFLGQQLTDIGAGAFQYCSRLVRLELPASLETISGDAFPGTTSLTYIGVQNGNTAFVSEDGVLFDHSRTTLVAYPAAHGSEYVIPEGVTNVGSCAFAFAKLTEIDLNGVVALADYAFIYSNLETLVLPDSITAMGTGVFYGNTSLRHLSVGTGITEISEQAFYGCDSLATVAIPAQIAEIGYGAFAFSGIREVSFEAGTSLRIIHSAAFFACAISEIDIPDTVVTIDAQAFSANQMLKRIGFGPQSQLGKIGESAFSNCTALAAISLPENLKTIGGEAFRNTALEQILIPDGVTFVGDGAFAGCNNLQEIAVAENNPVYKAVDGILFSQDGTVLHAYPAGKVVAEYAVAEQVRTIRPYAFYGAPVETILLPEGMTELGAYALYGSGISQVELPESLKSILEYALAKCINLRSIRIPEGVVQIGRFAFQGDWALQTVSFHEASQLPRISYGAFANCGISSITVPANVSTIAQGAFMGCGNLTQITFADNSKLESISAYMFTGCSNLQSITFGQGSALKSIQAHGFEGMNQLRSINLETTQLTNIDNFAFRFCRSLSSLQLPETLTNIGRYAFYGCESLSELTIPSNVEHIGAYAFLATDDMELYFASEALPAYLDENWDHGTRGYYLGVTSVAENGDYRYAVLTSGDIAILEYLGSDTEVDLTKADLGAPITQIGGSAFRGSMVTSVVLPETLTMIQAKAFQFTPLEQITIPAAVTFIGREAFAYSDVQSVTFAAGSQLAVMEQYAFAGTKNLTAVKLPASLSTMGTGVFMQSALESVIFEAGIQLTEIPQKAFAETQLVSIVLPDSITLVDHNAFHNVQTLRSVTFATNSELRLMSNAFYHTGLTALHIPANVTYIGECCFAGLFDLEEFSVAADNPNYKSELGLLLSKDGRRLIAAPGAMSGSITLPASVESIGAAAFEESSLSEVLFAADSNILTIGSRAFFESAITQITIPSTVVSIDYYAFGYCESLKSVAFAEGNALKGIYEGAFIGCIALEDIRVPDRVVEISEFAFYGCSKLQKLPFGENSSLKGIYDYAFAYSGISGDMIMPDSILDIGEYAFLGTRVTKVVIPDANKKNLIIGIGAFEECKQLTEITVPFLGGSYEDPRLCWFGYIFGAGAYEANGFYVPESLKTVTISDGITEIGTGAFAYCAGLETIHVPHSVSVLQGDAFLGTTASYELTNTITAYYNGWSQVYYNITSAHIGQGITGNVTLSDEVVGVGSGAFAGCANLTGITLGENVDWIGSEAFSNCTGLTRIEMCEGLTSIGDYAFDHCVGLTQIRLPQALTQIGSFAFADCVNLEEISGGSLEIIGGGAFKNCVKLAAITLPDTLTEIGGSAFNGCTALRAIQIPSGITWIDNGTFGNCTGLHEVVMPDTVTEICDYAFRNCVSLETITLSQNLQTIGSYAFADCGKLRNLALPDAVTSIGQYAFRNCASLTECNIPNQVMVLEEGAFSGCAGLKQVVIGGDITKIGSGAFSGCAGLKQVVIGDGVTEIGSSVFSGCRALESITIGSGVAKIGVDAFKNCEKLENVYITDVAAWCGIEFEEPRYSSSFINGHAEITAYPMYYADKLYLDGQLITELVIPEGVTVINPYAFEFVKHIKSVRIPSSVQRIGEYAFASMDIEALYISDLAAWCGIQFGDVDCHIFVGRSANPGYDARRIYVADKLLTDLEIPEGVTSIGQYAFVGFDCVVSLTLPQSVTQIGNQAFYECDNLLQIQNNSSLDMICGSEDNGYAACYAKVITDCYGNKTYLSDENGATYFCTADGYLYVQEGETYYLIAYLGDQDTITLPESFHGQVYHLRNFRGGRHVIIPEGVETLDDSAFAGNMTLQSVTLPQSLTKIGMYAFRDCFELKTISIPDGVTDIMGFAFAGSGITEIVLPERITFLNQNMFDGCKALERVVLGKEMRSLGWNAFFNCTALKEIELPDSLTQINHSAFWGCSSLTSIVIPDGVTLIDGQAFAFCENLTSITIPNSVTSIAYSVFEGCDNLRYIAIPESVTEIGEDTFPAGAQVEFLGENPNFQMIDGILYNGDLTRIISVRKDISGHIVIPDTVTEIFDGAFQGRTGLTGITFGAGVKTIWWEAFQGCTALEVVNFNDGVEYIGYNAFKGCTSLRTVTLPESLVELGDSAFAGCTALKSAVVTGGVEYLGTTFHGCTALEDVTLEEGITVIGYGCFEGCGSLKNISIPGSVVTIGQEAFKDCVALEALVIPEGVEALPDSVLYGCTGLKELTLPSTLKEVAHIFGYSEVALENVYISDLAAWCAINFTRDDSTPMYYAENLYLNGKLLTDLVIPEGVTSIGRYAFYGISHLESVTIPASVTFIGGSAFGDCDHLRSVYAPDLRSWCGITFESRDANPMHYDWESEPRNLYINGQILTELQIPEGISEIGAYTFYGCSALTKVHIPEGVTSIGSCAFMECERLEEIALPSSLSTIESDAFHSCSSLKYVRLPDGVAEIGYAAFGNCAALERIDIPESVVTIESYAFENCKALTSIILPEGLIVLGERAFDGCSALTEILIPDSVTAIGKNTFAGCTSLKTVIIGSGVASFDSQAFGTGSYDQCSSLERIVVDPENPYYYSQDGVLYDKPVTKILYLPLRLSGAISLAEGITEIGSYDLRELDYVTSITIPASVTEIAENAFSRWGNCPNLEKLIVAEGNGHYTAISGILYSADKTEILHIPGYLSGDIVIPEGITEIESYAFSDQSRIETVTLPEGVVMIGEYAFENCVSLRSIVLPESIMEIGRYAFRDCSNLLSVTLPQSLQTVGYDAFDGCIKLYVVYNNSDLELSVENWDSHESEVDFYALMLVDKAGNVTYRYGITDFSYEVTEDGFWFACENGEYTLLDYIGGEEELVLPEYIHGKAYRISYFTEGTSITIPKSMTKIDAEAFKGNQGLRSVILHDGIQSIEYGAFEGCRGLENISIPESVTSIASRAFVNCDGLTSLVIPDSVTKLGAEAFMDCSNLMRVVIGEGVTRIEYNTFYGCFNLSSLSIGSNVAYIGGSAFADCDALLSDETLWKNGMLVIDGWLFDVQEDLQYLTNPQDLRGALHNAYEGCYQLKNVVWNGSWDLTNVETIYISSFEGVSTIPALLTLKNIVICDSVKPADMQMAGRLFANLSGVTIYVDHAEMDLRWDVNFPGWNYGNRVIYSDGWNYITFFDADGNLLRSDLAATSAVIRRPAVTLPEDTEYVSYVFLGWDLDGDGLADSLPATSLVDINAVAVIGSSVRKFTVTFMDGQTGEIYWQQQIEYGSTVPLPQAPSLDGKVFLGWEGYEEGMTVTGDVTFTALWHEHSYGQWYVETEATCTQEGLMVRKCDGCGASETQVIAAQGHELSYKHDQTGHWQACANCDYTTDVQPHTGEVCDECGYDSRLVLGDVNGDGRVNARDARLLLRYAAGLADENEIVLDAADYNGDGRVNARDARALLRYAAGLD